MKVIDNYSLVNNNTFKINVNATRFIEYYTDEEILSFTEKNKELFRSEFLIIGEGSNLLFTKDYSGTVFHPATKRISIISEDQDFYYIEASAGVIFCDFIKWTIDHNAFGLENLSNIPGTIGASTVQNIGAYGVEAKDFISEVKFLNLNTYKINTFNNSKCDFAYRNSIFKTKLKNSSIILSVTFKLNKKFKPNLSYNDVRNRFLGYKTYAIDAKSIRNAIIEIRADKLPDPSLIGSAGSFFKNPIIDKDIFNELKKEFPDIRFFEHSENEVKIAAGWLIDKCKFKGFSYGDAAVYDKQALILINKGNASGNDIFDLSKIVRDKVYEVFKINLEPEVIIL